MFIVALVIWLICGLACADIYKKKGYPGGFGFLIGFMLGPLGLIIAAAKPKNEAPPTP